MKDEKTVEQKVSKIESFLNSELSYKPDPNTPDTHGTLWRRLSKVELAINGDTNNMGIQTKVRFMWWANYIIGFAAGNAFMFFVLKFLGK
jgi:hypothetical protein